MIIKKKKQNQNITIKVHLSIYIVIFFFFKEQNFCKRIVKCEYNLIFVTEV